MLGSVNTKTPQILAQKRPEGAAPQDSDKAATPAALPQDGLAGSAPEELPNLKDVRQRAMAAAAESADEAPVPEEKSGLSTGQKMILGAATIAAVGSAGAAQAADFGIIFGPDGSVGIHIGDGHHRHRGHHGGHYDNYICDAPNNTDGPYREGWGLDGQWHRFDRHNEVNDHTGHYRFTTDIYGNVNGVSCNVQHDGYWGY